MASLLELEKICLSAFDYKIKLGCNHSLADFDFSDTFYCFPNEALKSGPYLKDKNRLWQIFDGHQNDKNKSKYLDFLSQKEQMLSGEIPYKDVAYTEVSADYIRQFANGIMPLRGFSLLFYLAAVIYLVTKEKIDELNWGLDTMIFYLALVKDKQLDEFDSWASLNIQQRRVVAQFLKYLFEYSPVEYETASDALDRYWDQFLDG